jgi:tetratricopeptide (TPR) repeat protein
MNLRPTVRQRWWVAGGLVCLLVVAAWTSLVIRESPAQGRTPRAGEAWQPEDANTVVHRLRAPVPVGEREATVSRTLARQPATVRVAAGTARRAIERLRLSGDDADLGEAIAALAPWTAQGTPDPEIGLLQAIIDQRQHRFARALSGLDALLERPNLEPTLTAQALLTRASVHRVQAHWGAVRIDCERLRAIAAAQALRAWQDQAQACLAEVQTLTGAWRDGLAILTAMVQRAPLDFGLRLQLGELHARLGNHETALKALATSAQGLGDVYSRTAYVHALLDQGEAQRAWTAMAVWWSPPQAQAASPRSVWPGYAQDPLLLARAVAAKRLNRPEAQGLAAMVRARMDSLRWRAEAPDARESARVALDLADQPAQAHALALLNWQTQREPEDALLLVRAAVAAGKVVQAKGFVDEREREGWYDVRLSKALLSNP